MIRVSVSRADAAVTETETLTAGRVGLECGFTFTTEWDGLAKVAVFEGEQTIEVALGTASVAVVPPECMATPGYNLRIGVYGLSPSNAVVIPTVWAKAGKIKDSAAPDDESFAPATPELVAQIIGASQDALEIARSVEEQANSGAFDGEDGVSPTITVQRSGSTVTISITDVNGTTSAVLHDGADGEDGDDGISPTVSITDITGGHRVTITDLNGAHSADVMDGTPGTDGYSPVVTITTITGGHRVTITDEAHPQGQSFDVMDGTGGGGTVTVDDALSGTSENPVQNKVIKAALDGKGTYSKPSGGIPKSDLASAVKTSLGKADTALQSYTETDPTVPSWAKASSKPSYTASEVGAIAAPSSPASGAFLVWDGSAWVAQTLAAWQGGNY